MREHAVSAVLGEGGNPDARIAEVVVGGAAMLYGVPGTADRRVVSCASRSASASAKDRAECGFKIQVYSVPARCCSPAGESMHMAVMNAAYTYFIASAGPAEKRWMAEVALTRGYQQVAASAARILDQIPVAGSADRLSRLLYQGRERVTYSLNMESQAVRSAFDLRDGLAGLSAFAKQQTDRLEQSIRDRATALGLGAIQAYAPPRNPEAEKIVVRRKRMGTITLDNLPREQRENYPAASFWGVPVSALYWCDGKRNLAEVIRLTELEMGPQQFDFVGYFKFLQKHGYVDFVSAN